MPPATTKPPATTTPTRPGALQTQTRRPVILLVVATLLAALFATISPAPAGAAVAGPDGRSVERLYVAYFSRLPDAGGLAYWEGERASGRSLDEISERFAQSPEFERLYGSVGDAEFVELVYRNVLDRSPDEAGLSHWTSQLGSGALTRGGVMLGFSDSAEFKDSTGLTAPVPSGPDERSVERLYAAYFLREADADGLAYWLGRERAGWTLSAISETFAESPEFDRLYGSLSDAEFVELVYQNVLGRAPEASGLAHWTNQLATGALTRGGVMLGFSDSSEFKTSSGLTGPRPAPEPGDIPQAGNPAGTAAIPAEAAAVDTSIADHIVGSGTPASCTSAAVVAAVAQGGTIRFNCGADPVTIVMTDTARVFNNANPDVVIDGGGLVTLSGGGERRILYMNTCDPDLVWTTAHCQNQDHPRLTVQNINFVDAVVEGDQDLGGGGSAMWVRGGRLKIVNATFARNRCDATGPDVGGAVRVFSQYNNQPVYVVNSTFGGAPGQGNVCSNGGGLSAIGVSFTVLNSLFSHNEATGNGANPAQNGTPGGGSGGAIYNDGNTFTLTVAGTIIEDNHANEGGGAIFFVSNNRTGRLVIDGSTLRRNPSDGFETQGLPGIFYLGNGNPAITNSSLS